MPYALLCFQSHIYALVVFAFHHGCRLTEIANASVVFFVLGAGALLFAAGRFTWIQVAMMLMGNCVAILCSTVFNNMNDKRQYPTFWGLGYLNRLLTCDNGQNGEKSKKEKFK